MEYRIVSMETFANPKYNLAYNISLKIEYSIPFIDILYIKHRYQFENLELAMFKYANIKLKDILEEQMMGLS